MLHFQMDRSKKESSGGAGTIGLLQHRKSFVFLHAQMAHFIILICGIGSSASLKNQLEYHVSEGGFDGGYRTVVRNQSQRILGSVSVLSEF